MTNSCDIEIESSNKALPNFVPLSPVAFLERSAEVYGGRTAVIYGDKKFSYSELHKRCLQLASAILNSGVKAGETVSIIADNIPAMIELHFAVPMARAVLNCINTRLDPTAIAYIIDHSSAVVIFVDYVYLELIKAALSRSRNKPRIIVIFDDTAPSIDSIDASYDDLLRSGECDFLPLPIDSELLPISLNYTSGTTGNPKGVLSCHRAAYLNSLGNLITLGLNTSSIYLWTLPLFHCNGWCHAWAVTAAGGVHVCLRKPSPSMITMAIQQTHVTHFSAAPVVLTGLSEYLSETGCTFNHTVKAVTGGASPTPTLILNMEQHGFEITHLYGLSESFGPVAVCEPLSEWTGLDLNVRHKEIAKQGAKHVTADTISIVDTDTMLLIPADGITSGEVALRSNTVMLGYLGNKSATNEAFRGGWFLTGDIGVQHPNGYIEIKDRKKDVIISGGENISSLEVEACISKHPEVLEVAVVAMPHPKWGESPCAFICLRSGKNVTEEEIIAFCRNEIAHFKIPSKIKFCELPKTGTGKIMKYELRRIAADLATHN